MKAIVNSMLGLAIVAGVYVGDAAAASQGTASGTVQPQGFLSQVREAQLGHVDQEYGTTVRTKGRLGGTQSFGRQGGVLNAIWHSHFASYKGHEKTERPSAVTKLARPNDFMTDVRRSQFQDFDV